MTVSRATALLFTFQSKMEEAVCLVPRMCPEEKLKAVHFWNLVSEKLQDIVNSSAADINAVAFKMDEAESEKFNLALGHSTLGTVPQNNSLTQDYLNIPSSFQLSNDINSSPLKQLFSNEVSFTNNGHPSTGEINNISHIHNLNSEIDMPKSTDTQDVCDQLLELANISSNSCDTFTKNTNSLSEIPIPSEHHNAYSSDKGEPSRDCAQRQQPSRKAKSRDNSDGFYCDMDIVPENFSLNKNQNTSKNSNSEPSTSKSSKSETVRKYLEKSQNGQNPLDFNQAGVKPGKIGETNGSHESFPVPNSEAILENSSSNKHNESSGDASTSDKTVFLCKACKKGFPSKSDLSSHFWKFHKSFKCTECPSVFLDKRNLVVHMRKHTGERPYVCTQCKMGFTTHGNLKRHTNTHKGEKPWKCEECNARFTEKKSLTIHMRRHTGERPYSCNFCGKRFTQSGILQTHLAMHLDLKVHLCELCGKSFRQKSQLRMHKLRHENNKKFGCDSCSAFFLTKGDLDRHARKHTGEKPFVCEVCSKSFTRQQSLNEHLNRHYGIKPYICNFCGKAFFEMSSCYKHIKQHPKPGKSSDSQKDQTCVTSQEHVVPPTSPEPASKAKNVENVLPNLDGQQYYTVVLNSKEGCGEVQNENNQTIVFNSGSEENGFGVLTTINFLNVPPIPQTL